MKEKQRIYSYRKFKGIGLASAVVGLAFLTPSNGGGVMPVVHAESVTEHRDSSNLDNQSDKVVLKSAESASDAATNDAPRPEGNVVARGEDGVPWELYENGYLLFKPEAGKDTLTNNNGKTSWKHQYGPQIKYVGFAGKVYAPEDSAALFSSYSVDDNENYGERGINVEFDFNPTSLDTTNFDTSKATDMSYMFSGLSNLKSLDVSHFDTSKVTDMRRMFNDVHNVTELDVSQFDTRNVTNMRAMFYNMHNVKHLDVTNFNTSNVGDMVAMFSHLYQLTELDVTNFDTRNVTNMSSMFSGLSKLTKLDVTHFNTSNVTDMSSMFDGMINLEDLDVTHFDTRNVTDMSRMFAELYKLKSLDVTRFNTSNVTDMGAMFSRVQTLTKLDVTNFDTRNVTTMDGMFNEMTNVTSLDVTKFDTHNVTVMSHMFDQTPNLVELDVSNFNTSQVKEMDAMFRGMSKMTKLDVSSFNTHNVRDAWDLFKDMSKLRELKLGDAFSSEHIQTIPAQYDDEYPSKWHKVGDYEHLYSVEELANLYQNNPSGTAGTWVREEAPKDTTLTFDGETLPPVKVSPNAPTLPELPRPTQPKPNHKFKGWSRTPDGEPIKPTDIQPGENITLHPIWEAVDGSQTRTEKIPVTKIYEEDNTLDYGKQTETPGVEGEKTITTTHTVTPYTGELTNPVESEVIIKPMKPTVVKVGTKSINEVEVIPSPKQYEKDYTRDKGQPDTIIEGKPGSKTTTTTYTVDSTNGTVTPKQGEPVTVEPTPTIVKVAAKDKVVETPIEPKVVYEKDETRDEGTPNQTTPGEKGKTVTTTTYDVNPNDGAVTETVGEPVVTPAGVTKVKVGAKPRVETIKDGGKTVQRTTTYDVDQNTGKVTPHVNDQVIGDNGGITPPTVEIPEYNKPTGGADLDGEGGHITPPTVEIPEYHKPIGGAGLDGEGGRITPPTVEIPEYTETEQPQTLKPEITPPTVEVPEYTGTIGGAGLDGEGGLITPPTVDKPIYNGDIEPTIERQVIPSGKRYEKDDSREKGQPDIAVPGKDGSVTTTFHYHVDKDGNVISSKGSSVTEEPVSTIIKVAAKDKVEVKVVESPKRYVGDDTKELGDDSETSGTPGEVHIRTIYDVNPETGDITERTEKELRIVPTETVITKGTKPSVKTVERDGKVYEQTTTYTVNEKTGELTSSTTEKLIKDAEKQTETQKQLPNTGDAGALASLAGLGVGLLGVRLGRKREE